MNTNSLPQDLIQRLKNGDQAPGQLALEILEQGLQQGDFHKSLNACHTQGVDSIVLQDFTNTNQGMIRFYFAHHGKHQLNNLFDKKGHFTVGIHNHRYDIAKIALNDIFYNVRTRVATEKDPETQTMYEYRFASGIQNKKMGATNHKKVQMTPTVLEKFSPGEVALMNDYDLHTMKIPYNKSMPGTAWLVIEGNQTGIEPLLYSPKPGLQLSSQDLYQPMPASEAQSILKEVYEMTQKVLG